MKNFFKSLKDSIGMRFSLLLFNARPLIFFELLFNIVSTSVILPLLFLLFRFSMRMSGFNLITGENLIQFLLSPITIILIIVLLMAVAYMALVDISASIFVFECARQRKHTSLKDISMFAFKSSLRMFQPKNLLIMFVVLVILPLVSIGTNSNFIGKYSIPPNLREVIFSNIWLIVIAGIAFGVIVFLSMKWVFAIHYFILERLDFVPSIKKSWHLLRGNTIRNFISIMIVQIIIALLMKLLNTCGGFLIRQISETFGTRTLVGSFGISLATVSFLVIYLILFAIFLPYSCLKISALFYERKKAAGEEIVNLRYQGIKKTKKNSRRFRIALFSVMAVFVLLCTFVLSFSQSKNFSGQTSTFKEREVIDTKSSKLDRNHNSLSAIQKAAEQGANTIEVDVQISNDNIPFLGTNSLFDTQELSELSFDEISQNAQIEITSAGLTEAKIPTLEEALQCAAENNINLMLDVGSIKYQQNKLDVIFELINKLQLTKSVSIASKNYNDIAEAKAKLPSITTVYKIGSAIGDFSEFDATDTFALDQWCIDSITINDIHNMGRRIIALDVNSSEKIERAMTSKIDGLTTINVQKAVELNNSKGLPEFMYVFSGYL